MPHTVNGIGTWYYGKKNVIKREGVCEKCGRSTTLSSYDTREYIVVVFVPIIPLRRKRILDSCPACTYHYSVPLKKYNETKRQAYEEAVGSYKKRPKDPEAAAGLIGLYSSYWDKDAFLGIVGTIAGGFEGNAKVLAEIGVAYHRFGDVDKAEEYYLKSLDIDDDAGVNETLGFLYLDKSEPEKAEEYFQHIIENRIVEKAGMLLSLVQGYQYKGKHEDALEVLEQLSALDPAMEGDKSYKRLKKVSEKRRGTNKPVKDNRRFDAKHQIHKPYNAKLVWGVAALLLVGFFVVYCVVAYQKGASRIIYLVNGLSRPYTVLVDSEPYAVAAGRSLKVNIAEGEIVVEVDDDILDFPAETYEIKTPFFKRPFLEKAFVINPDTVALVFCSVVYYAENPENAPMGEHKLFIGGSFYVFDDVDYVFEPLPDVVSLPGGSPVAKRRLSLAEDQGVAKEYLSTVITNYHDEQTAIECLKKRVRFDPDDEYFLFELYSKLGAEEFIDVIKPGLDVRPIRMNWHRFYQEAREKLSPECDLASEYKKFLEKNPDSSDLKYLLARVIKDPKEALVLLKESVSGAEPCAYGYYGLSYQKMSAGEFEEALPLVEKAMELDPENDLMRQYRYDVLRAGRQYDEAIKYCRKKQGEMGLVFAWVNEEIRLQLLRGEAEKAQQVFDKWAERSRKVVGEEIIEEMSNLVSLTSAYVSGDIKGYGEKLTQPMDPNEQFILALNLKEPVDENFVHQVKPKNPYTYLLSYIHEHRLGNAESAEKYLSAAAEMLAQKPWPESVFAEALTDEGDVDPEELCSLVMEVKSKVILLTALGVRYPKHREVFFGLADKLNYDVVFPYHFIKSIHGKPASDE
jgi:tetratricopeptide (TPR) repeat protein